MILTRDATKTLAKIVYELRAEAKVLSGIHEMLPEAKLMQLVLLRQSNSIELIVTQAISDEEALTQGERGEVWMLMRDGRSQLD